MKLLRRLLVIAICKFRTKWHWKNFKVSQYWAKRKFDVTPLWTISLVALNCDRRKICWSSVSSDIRQRRTVRTCAAALNNLSTAAELGSVELIFTNAVASVGHGRSCQWTGQLGWQSLIFTLLLVECHWSCKWLLNNTQQSGMSCKPPPVKIST